jgi:hypothetical protein
MIFRSSTKFIYNPEMKLLFCKIFFCLQYRGKWYPPQSSEISPYQNQNTILFCLKNLVFPISEIGISLDNYYFLKNIWTNFFLNRVLHSFDKNQKNLLFHFKIASSVWLKTTHFYTPEVKIIVTKISFCSKA